MNTDRRGNTASFNPHEIRELLPLFATGGQGGMLHYLDNAAMSPMPRLVMDEVMAFETARANVQRSAHRLAERAGEAYNLARVRVAGYLGVPPREIVFTSGATAAINLLAHGFGELLQAGDEILLSQAEHHSNLVPWQQLARRRGVVLRFVPVSPDGALDLSGIETLLGERCKLVALTHASNVSGAITPLNQLSELTRARNIALLLDGAQRIPHGPFDLGRLGADFYVFSGHKCFAPTGIGVLWAREEWLQRLPPLLTGGGMVAGAELERSHFQTGYSRFEAGTPPLAQAIGLGAALHWLASLPWEAIRTHEQRLFEHLLQELRQLADLQLIAPCVSGLQLPLVSFSLAGIHAHDLSYLLDQEGVAVRGGQLCAEPMLRALGFDTLTRASIALYNSQEDIDALIDALRRARDLLG